MLLKHACRASPVLHEPTWSDQGMLKRCDISQSEPGHTAGPAARVPMSDKTAVGSREKVRIPGSLPSPKAKPRPLVAGLYIGFAPLDLAQWPFHGAPANMSTTSMGKRDADGNSLCVPLYIYISVCVCACVPVCMCLPLLRQCLVCGRVGGRLSSGWLVSSLDSRAHSFVPTQSSGRHTCTVCVCVSMYVRMYVRLYAYACPHLHLLLSVVIANIPT